MKGFDPLKKAVSEYGKVLVCFSGGLDSTALLHICRERLGENAVAFKADVPMESRHSADLAEKAAEALGCRVVHGRITGEETDEILGNGADRCLLCKRAIYRSAAETAVKMGIEHIVCGDNADDDPESRPGMKAAAEFGVLSPLREYGIGRDAVEQYVRGLELGFDTVKETCMLMRYTPGKPVTHEDLRRAETAEERIRSLTGVKQIRARFRDVVLELQTSENEMHVLEEKRAELKSISDSLGMELRLSDVPYRG